MERQLTSTKNMQLNWLERILYWGRLAWNRSAPLYLRYGLPYFLGGGGRLEVEADGARFGVRRRSFDLYILWEVFERRVYEPRCSLRTKPRVVVDLGANIGAFSLWSAQRWAPDRIVAVEMEPENFSMLQENVRANPGNEVVLLQRAVWDRDCSVQIRRHRLNHGMHEVRPESGELEIPARTLGSLLREAGVKRVDFLKVDIEGAERQLFTQANAAIFSASVKFVAAELHPNKGVDVAGIVRYLQAAGFDVEVRRQRMNRALMMEAVNQRPL